MSQKISIEKLQQMKIAGRKIASLTAYDASFARILDESGVEVVLVGDSLGMVLQGAGDTLNVSMDDMIYHTKMVSPVCQRALVVTDMPNRSYDTPAQGLENARRLVQEAGAQVVKLEGGEEVADIVVCLTDHNIAVCGHVGLQPQSVEKYGGYKVQGRDKKAAEQILNGARALQAAGAMMIVLECIPVALAERITAALNIPTIGIGAGAACDGQVLVLHDLLGISARSPHMAKNFLADGGDIRAAVAAYVSAVKSASFPADEHSFH